jgi:hypothetical protein
MWCRLYLFAGLIPYFPLDHSKMATKTMHDFAKAPPIFGSNNSTFFHAKSTPNDQTVVAHLHEF